MISVIKLTKTYESKVKRQPPVRALNNISFNLPDVGLIFITGKSGSGKSTLLNMLGGLDNITKGDIIADGNRFSQFTTKDYDSYRNSYLGFIFQDYCLIEDLTVRQNIELVLDLNRKKDDGTVQMLLNKMHLNKYGDRYPRELSGGQKQRVAIARALAKDPQMILADEPTGNLDSKTANQIMKILKELSKSKLVVVVSHNLDDAMKYGDRIIELADGVIIRDEQIMQGYSDELENINGKLILPHKKEYDESEIKQINKWLKAYEVDSVVQREPAVMPTNNDEIKVSKVCENVRSRLSLKKSVSLSGIFLKRRRLGFITTTIILTCLFVILGLCQFFVEFNYKNAIDLAVASEGQQVIVGYKGSLVGDKQAVINTSFAYEITNADILTLAKYNGVYELLNNSIYTTGSSQLLRQEIKPSSAVNLSNFYLLEGYGTLVCDEDYLTKYFGINGELQFIGDLNDQDYGIIITDYVADALIHYNPSKYSKREDVLGLLYEDDLVYNMYVNAIIDTHYDTKYIDFGQKLMNEYASTISQGKSSSILESDEFAMFADDVVKRLGVAYSVNNNFKNDVANYHAKNYTRIDYSYISSSDLSTPFYTSNLVGYVDSDNKYDSHILNSGEISMSMALYNKIFLTSYNSSNYNTFNRKDISIARYSRFASDLDNTPKINKSLTITKLLDTTDNVIILSKDDFNEFRQVETYCYSLYFSDVENMSAVYGDAEEREIYISSDAYNSVKTIISIVNIFKDFFLILTMGLCFMGVLLLANFGVSNIRRRKYEIGVIKAMGGQTLEVGKIFILQILVIGLIVCALSSVLLTILSPMVNNVLLNAMLYFVGNSHLASISIIDFHVGVVALDIIAMLTITAVSAIIPLATLHKIKPVNIIKHKN